MISRYHFHTLFFLLMAGGSHSQKRYLLFGARFRRPSMNGTIIIQKNISLADKTTFKTGGQAAHYAEVTSVDELKQVIHFAKERGLSFFVLGGGSNVLIGDETFPGLVIHPIFSNMAYENIDDQTVRVISGAGIVWDDLVSDTVSRGLYGLENLSFIPGSVGAAPIQNIGAYGQEVGSVIESVRVFDSVEGKEVVISKEACQFSYRHSLFKTKKGKHLIVMSISFLLSKKRLSDISYKDLTEYFKDQKTPPTLQEVRKAVIAIRTRKLPDITQVGTAGSFFKNPIISREQYNNLLKRFPNLPHYVVDGVRVKIPLAWILDNVLHVNGLRKGNVGLYEMQPLVVVNYGEATTKEVRTFVQHIKEKIKQECNIVVEQEVQNLF